MSLFAQKHNNCPTCTCTDPVNPDIVSDLLFGASPEELSASFKQEPDFNLRQYGFAEGNYSCKCLDCGCDYMGDKRSSNCYQCAVEEYKNDETNSDNWDNAQWHDSGWDACEKHHRDQLVSISVAFGKSVAKVDKLEMENAMLRDIIEDSGIDVDESLENLL